MYDDDNVDGGIAAYGLGTAAVVVVVLFLGIACTDSPKPGPRPRFGGRLWLLLLILRLLMMQLALSSGPGEAPFGRPLLLLPPPDLMLGASVGAASGLGAWCWAYAVSLVPRLSAASIPGFREGPWGSG